MIARMTVALPFLFVAACGSTRTAPSPDPTAPPAQPSSSVITPEECTRQGGQVRGDIGNGQIACGEGERELGRVQLGIEGGVCCAPATPVGP